MENKSMVAIDKNGRYLREMKKAIPKLRIFEEIHSLTNQY